ncbi:helix-turn-helix transcriptional regulator [Aquimarina sp. U1-2]|uniref:helix-turn-helix transcriptional regulator n=1 Tax=Aquimarina sp. U1-2 TaxID=2823141 RepID=UPI001AED03FE|nr:helix-turn-helix transcriptional regulator [Aquimarina sp. U1-2]MBP2830857.1 helix-turn-helix transcriptional regulator [Aquimarina sp. U1-2]
MIFNQHQIPLRLEKYVTDLLYHKDYYPNHKRDKYLPDGTINIIFELTNNPKFIYDNVTGKTKQECKNVWFSGVLKDYITISSHHEEMMVLVFKPGTGFPLIYKDISKFTNQVVPAEQVFGDSILNLLKDLKLPTTPEEKFLAIEKWLDNQLTEDDFYLEVIRYAIDAIENSPTQINLSELSDKLGYSQKQFIQLFKKYVGLTPKQFHRVIRFNEILAAVENQETISWTIVAADCGYFDQAHFIKDFQSFSGINPKKYLSDIEDYPNFLPVK